MFCRVLRCKNESKLAGAKLLKAKESRGRSSLDEITIS